VKVTTLDHNLSLFQTTSFADDIKFVSNNFRIFKLSLSSFKHCKKKPLFWLCMIFEVAP
jgi:hypothetical protein